MLGVSDKKGISDGKLEHIMWGTVKGTEVTGYHCDTSFSDRRAEVECKVYPKSHKVIKRNKELRVFEGMVREKGTPIRNVKNVRSTFFCAAWNRQEVVDCIDRIKGKHKVYDYGKNSVYRDPKTGLILVDTPATSFPLLRL